MQNAELLVVKAAGTYSHRPAKGVNEHQTIGPKDTVGVEIHRHTDMVVTQGCLSTYNCAKRSLKCFPKWLFETSKNYRLLQLLTLLVLFIIKYYKALWTTK
jgi:hypothetical protein